MGNNTWFNINPYRSDVSHIPSTHYESRNLYDLNIVFVYGSIAKKFDLFKKSLSELVVDRQKDNYSECTSVSRNLSINGVGVHSGIVFNNELLSDTDELALSLLNIIFSKLLYELDVYEEQFAIPLDLVESYLSNSTTTLSTNIDPGATGTDILVKEIDSPNESTYPYELNNIDTGVPTDLYYEIKNISTSLVAIIVYDGFFDYLFKNDNIKSFTRHLVLKLHEFMTMSDIAKLGLFRSYIKTL